MFSYRVLPFPFLRVLFSSYTFCFSFLAISSSLLSLYLLSPPPSLPPASFTSFLIPYSSFPRLPLLSLHSSPSPFRHPSSFLLSNHPTSPTLPLPFPSVLSPPLLPHSFYLTLRGRGTSPGPLCQQISTGRRGRIELQSSEYESALVFGIYIFFSILSFSLSVLFLLIPFPLRPKSLQPQNFP